MSRPRREIALSKAFGGPCALTLQQLCRTFRCSRATILRRLAEHGYYKQLQSFRQVPHASRSGPVRRGGSLDLEDGPLFQVRHA